MVVEGADPHRLFISRIRHRAASVHLPPRVTHQRRRRLHRDCHLCIMPPPMRMRDRSNSPEPVTFLAPFATDDPCSSDAAAAGAAVAASLDDATPALHGAVAHSASQLSDGSTFVGYINAIPRGRPPLSLEEASIRARELQTGSRRRKKRKPHAPSRRDLAVTHDPVTILTQRRWGSSSSARAARKRKDERAAASAVYAEEVGSCRRQHFWWLQLSQSS